MNGALLIIGDELLLGTTIDTNSAWLGRRLAEVGIEVKYKLTVGDSPKIIEDELRRLLEKFDIIITTGGLGPTLDDVTKKSIAKVLGKKLVLNERILKAIKKHFQKRGVEMPAINMSQALIPQGAHPIKNPVGTAPGLFLKEGEKWIFILPGVPSEMKAIFEEGVLPVLSREGKKEIRFRTIKTTGITESRLAEILDRTVKEVSGYVTVSFLPRHTGVNIRIKIQKGTEGGDELLKKIEEKFTEKIGIYTYGRDEETMEEVVGYLLTMRNFTLSVAESCTGGLIKHRITNVSGSSKYFIGGVVAYSNEVKQNLLGVPEQTLQRYGAVSQQTAISMAKGIRSLLKTDIGLSVTGIAGPSGGSVEKPVGLVYIGLLSKGKTSFEEHRFLGDRIKIKEQTAQAALDMLRRYLLNA